MGKQEKKKKDRQPDFFRRLKRNKECSFVSDETKPAVCEVFPLRDYWLLLFFSNGEVRLYDCAWVLRVSNLEKLDKKDFLVKAQVDRDMVKWNKYLAISSEEIYGNSTPLTDVEGKILRLL